jgi:enolase-phosphatase E1
MDRDRKSPGLKRLQGQIWEIGYRAGELRGDVFPDTAPAIRRWRAQGIDVAIYSSGSVLAQRHLFESTPAGDLTGLIRAFFDTAVGPKTASDSYIRIAQALGHEPSRILFVSDVTAELSAARAAGFQVRLSVRPGNPSQADAAAYELVVGGLDGI